MATDKNFIVKNGLEVGGQEVISSSGVVTSAALGGQTLASTDSPTFANLTVSNDLAVSGDLNLTGDLNITGDVNSLSVTDLDVVDKTITLGAGQVESASGGSGIIVDGSNASILWDETNTEWDFNNSINVTGSITADGLTVDGNALLRAATSTLQFRSADGTSNGYNIKANVKNTNDFGFIFEDKDQKDLLKIQSNNDISFYEDTGTSVKFFWDASTERLGIGTTSPDSTLTINGNTNAYKPYSYAARNYGVELGSSSISSYLANISISSRLVLSTGGFYYGSGQYKLENGATGGGVIIMGDDGELIYGSTSGQTADSIVTMPEKLRIDSSGNVGIGTSSVDANSQLHIKKTGANAKITIECEESYDSYINFSGATSEMSLGYDATDNAFIIANAGDGLTSNERMRIDLSGNLLVGTTSESTWESAAGFRTRQSGSTTITRDGNPPLYVNRLTNDGDIIVFKKGTTTVGSIGVSANDNLYIAGGSGNTKGLYFNDAGVVPATTGGSPSDNTVDLGQSGIRFKDLYLSGTANAATLNIVNQSGATLDINTNLAAADSKILLHEGTSASPVNGASIRYDGANNLFKIGVGSNVDTTRLVIERDTGKVGIGVEDPKGTLHIADPNANTDSELLIGNAGTSSGGNLLGSIWFGSAESSGYRAAGIKSTADQDFNANDTPADLSFWTTNDNTTGATKKVTIDSGGSLSHWDSGQFTRRRTHFSQGLSTYQSINMTADTNHEAPWVGFNDLGIVTLRGFAPYVDIKTNHTANSLMFMFKFEGYLYNRGNSVFYGGGYTYNGGVVAKDTGSANAVLGPAYVYELYRASSDSALCIKIHANVSNATYDEGKIAVSLFTFGQLNTFRLVSAQITDSTSNYY